MRCSKSPHIWHGGLSLRAGCPAKCQASATIQSSPGACVVYEPAKPHIALPRHFLNNTGLLAVFNCIYSAAQSAGRCACSALVPSRPISTGCAAGDRSVAAVYYRSAGESSMASSNQRLHLHYHACSSHAMLVPQYNGMSYSAICLASCADATMSTRISLHPLYAFTPVLW